ncbi:MAG: GxxExxY protein [Bacteroidetes bacterium]|nr:GxxExxY protein [Bacteroidota bacterium]
MKADSKIITQKDLDELTFEIIGCAIEVHKQLGPGLLESVYEKCFIHELSLRGLSFKSQQRARINYKGLDLDADLRYDVLVEDLIVVELKSNDGILPIHEAVLLTYLKMLEKPKGIMLNFNCTNIFREGQKTFVNEFYAKLPKI